MNKQRISKALVAMLFTALTLTPCVSSAQRAPSAPQTEWADVFGRAIAAQVRQEAKKILRPGSGPIEVTIKMTITPYDPSITKPTWTPDDIKNLDICAQICTGLSCYIDCSAPKIT